MNHPMPNHHRQHQPRAALIGRMRGLSLIELMIGIVVSLIILLAMSTVFVNSSSARRELQLSADALESGRYAIDMLTRDLSQTGYLGTLTSVPPASDNAVVPSQMCNQTLATWQATLSTHVVGYQDGGYPATCAPAKTGTDALFVQRASTCAVGEANCAAEVDSHAYLQVSECGFEYSTMPLVLAAGNGGNAVFNLQSRPCNSTGFSSKRRLIRRMFYVTPANILVSQEIPLTGVLPAPVVLVEGIEDLQVEYAVDANNNGSVDAGEFEANPADWRQVIGVRVGVLSISPEAGRSPVGARTFGLPGKSIVKADDRIKRRGYSTTIMFESPTARRQS